MWHAGAQYRLGNTTLVAQGGMTKADAGGVNGAAARKADSFTVGAIHNLSKRTSLFGGYQHVYVDNPNAAAVNDLITAPGATVNYVAPTYVAPGSNRSTFTIGLRHNF